MRKLSDIPVLSFFIRRKFLSFFLLLILAIILFKGSIYRACISYKIISPRNRVLATGINFSASIVQDKKTLGTSEIIDWSLDTTATLLSFTTGQCSTNGLHLLQEGGKTNCIGYSGLCALLCQANFDSQGSPLESKPVIAQLYLFGYNIHRLFDNPFWKDHDIVLITDTKTGERILLDPTLYDYSRIGIVRERK